MGVAENLLLFQVVNNSNRTPTPYDWMFGFMTIILAIVIIIVILKAYK